MDLVNIILPLGVSIVLGALVGLEREKRKQESHTQSSVGIRTDILVCLFGAISAYLGQVYEPIIFIISLGAILAFIISSYIYLMVKYKQIGITTEISTILVFLYGAMTTTGHLQLAIILAILTTGILSIREKLHTFVKQINYRELYDTIIFAIIAFIILPILPNEPFDEQVFGFFFPDHEMTALAEFNILNPYQIWFLVVLVSGISFLGYILVKTLGSKKGIGFTGLLGGLYSSTATSLTLASKSKEMTKTKLPFITGIVLACGISYLRTYIEIRALNEELFLRTFIPVTLMFIYLMAIGFYLMFITKEKPTKADTKTFESPFKLRKAIELGAFITVALIIAKVSLTFAGVEWYYLIATLMAFFAIDDPIIISTAATAGTLINFDDAKNIILLVLYLNMVQKVAIMYFFGNRKLVKHLGLIFGGLLLVTLTGIFYL